METPALTAESRRPLVEMLARAFLEDPAFIFMLPDPTARAKGMTWLFERWLRARSAPSRGDHALVDEGGPGLLIGVDPDGQADVPFWTMLRLGLAAMPFVFGAGAFRRFLAIDADVKRRHAAELTAPHHVIDILAVDPAAHGRGIGSALLGAYLGAVDQLQAPAYLITHNPRNVGFYQRAGFQVIREARVSKDGTDGPIAWSMRRSART
jgi:ribosomal protein S18 acetylase RimI-like enzyme